MPDCINCGRPVAYSGSGEVPRYCWRCEQQLPGRSVTVQVPQRAVVPRPPVTLTLLGVNVLVYVAMVMSGVSATEPTPNQLIRWGADYAPLTLTSEPWRLLTSAFVHIGFLHLLVNMYSLWNLGSIAENIFGRLSFLMVYLYTAISASLLSILVHPHGTSAGASGAIFGLAGALIAALYLGKLPIPAKNRNAALRNLVIVTIINLAIGATIPMIDNAGHIGGFLLGLLIGALLSPSLTKDRETKAHAQRVIFSAVALGLAVAIWFVRKVV